MLAKTVKFINLSIAVLLVLFLGLGAAELRTVGVCFDLGALPLGAAEIRAMSNAMKHLILPELALIAEKSGSP